jgi:hypothetical protein
MSPERAPENPKILMLNEQVICALLRGDTITNITPAALWANERADFSDDEILEVLSATKDYADVIPRLIQAAKSKGFDDAKLSISDPRMWQVIWHVQACIDAMKEAHKNKDLDRLIQIAQGVLGYRAHRLPNLGTPDYDALLEQA